MGSSGNPKTSCIRLLMMCGFTITPTDTAADSDHRSLHANGNPILDYSVEKLSSWGCRIPGFRGQEADLSSTLQSPKHEILRRFVVAQRKKAKLRQVDVAKRLGRYQSYVTNIETGQRRIDVVELLGLAEAIGFDPK